MKKYALLRMHIFSKNFINLHFNVEFLLQSLLCPHIFVIFYTRLQNQLCLFVASQIFFGSFLQLFGCLHRKYHLHLHFQWLYTLFRLYLTAPVSAELSVIYYLLLNHIQAMKQVYLIFVLLY